MWALRWKAVLVEYEHWVHLNGFSPDRNGKCVLMCTSMCCFWAAANGHSLHLYGFSPVCVRMCLTSEKAWLAANVHSLH
jgi:hypothetical protein